MVYEKFINWKYKCVGYTYLVDYSWARILVQLRYTKVLNDAAFVSVGIRFMCKSVCEEKYKKGSFSWGLIRHGRSDLPISYFLYSEFYCAGVYKSFKKTLVFIITRLRLERRYWQENVFILRVYNDYDEDDDNESVRVFERCRALRGIIFAVGFRCFFPFFLLYFYTRYSYTTEFSSGV